MNPIMEQLVTSLAVLVDGKRIFEDDVAGKIKKGILEDGIDATVSLINVITDKGGYIPDYPTDTTKDFENMIMRLCKNNLGTEAAKKMFSAMTLMEVMIRNGKEREKE